MKTFINIGLGCFTFPFCLSAQAQEEANTTGEVREVMTSPDIGKDYHPLNPEITIQTYTYNPNGNLAYVYYVSKHLGKYDKMQPKRSYQEVYQYTYDFFKNQTTQTYEQLIIQDEWNQNDKYRAYKIIKTYQP